MKNKKIFIILFVIFLVSCDRNYRINTLQDVEDTIEIGNRLVKNIEKYKNKYGKYPEKLEDLVPEFYDKVPKTKMKYYDNNNFNIRYKKYSFYRNQAGLLENDNFSLGFDGNLINQEDEINFGVDNPCSNYIVSNKYLSDIYLNRIKRKTANNYKNFYFYNCNNCHDFENLLKCKFRNQLKYPYIKVQITE